MKRHIWLLGAMLRRSIKQALTWRAFLLTLVLSQVVAPLISWAVWSAAMPGAQSRAYYVALLVTNLAVCSYEQHTTSAAIYGGEFAFALLAPYPLTPNSFLGATALRILHLFFALPLTAPLIAWAWPDFAASAPLALPALLGALALRFLYGHTLALTAFFTQRAWGIVSLGNTAVACLGGEAVTLLLPAFRRVAQYLPFRYMLGFPAELAAGSLAPDQIISAFAAQSCFLACALLVHRLVLQRGLRAYQGAES